MDRLDQDFYEFERQDKDRLKWKSVSQPRYPIGPEDDLRVLLTLLR